jgi:hypothetical protein
MSDSKLQLLIEKFDLDKSGAFDQVGRRKLSRALLH